MRCARLLVATALCQGALANPPAPGQETETAKQTAHPTAPSSSSRLFQNFDVDDFHLSSHKDYEGQKVSIETVTGSAFEDDVALVLKGDSQRYGITMDMPQSVEDGDLVLQYEVRMTKGLKCGGAYLKLLDANNAPENGDVTPDSPYIIMFGPDKCGDTDKVHFIMRHQNPVSKEWEEKHFRSESPLTIQNDKLSHLYTLVIRQDNTFSIKVDGVDQKSGHLLQNMQPPINPEEEINDPNDKKPSDWVDDAKIPDPEVFKPDDWDEDAPKTIEDITATMPDGWLEHEMLMIPSPQPDDWDDEEDGEWEPVSTGNPKCTSAPGCGPWTPPMIPNPDYKGKWNAPLIDNPDYIGEWKPQRIKNPSFFVDTTPAEGLLSNIGSIALEVWIHEYGDIAFDNILVGNSEDDAAALADATFKIKSELEHTKGSELERKRRHEQNLKYLEQGGFGVVQYYIFEALDFARDWPIVVAGGILALLALLIYICCNLCCSGEDDGDFDERSQAAAPADASQGTEDEATVTSAPVAQTLSEDDDNDAPSLDPSNDKGDDAKKND